jgi:hypothetical protein
MSCDKFSIDDESVNRILEGIKNINSKKLTDTEGVELEPYIQDLIPWIRNVDKRKITICNGCGVTFIASKAGQKSCSSMCRNLAWRRETGYQPNRDYIRKGKPENKDDRSAYQHQEGDRLAYYRQRREDIINLSLIEQARKREAGLSKYVDFIDSENPNEKGRD